MGYITSDYYYSTYKGAEVTDDINVLIERASDIIDVITGNKIKLTGGFDKLPNEFIQNQVMLATAAETDYLDRNGGLSSLDSSTPVQMTLGKFSYMNGAGTSERKSFPISALALGYLECTGLMGRSLQ